MRELTALNLKPAVAMMRSSDDPLTALLMSKRARVQAMQAASAVLADELRVIECFAKLRADWATLPPRNKLRHVLGHGVAFAPSELAAITGHKVNTIISTLARMRSRGEVKRERFGRWVTTRKVLHAD